MKPGLQVNDLHFQYSANLSFDFPDMDCEQGSHWLIIGQSGCGKTTLLHLIGGLLQASQGSIHIDTTDITKLTGATIDKFRGQNVGIIFQQSHLIKALTVEDNLLAAQYLAGKPKDRNKIKQILEKLNLGQKLHSYPAKLSLGEQQRVAIARALVNDPVLILADEPTSSLDDYNCQEVLDLLLQQSKEQNATLLIVTHDSRLKERFENQIELTSSKTENLAMNFKK